MANLISVTVEKRGTVSYQSPFPVEQIDATKIKFVQPEFTDVFNDRSLLQFYDNQSQTIIPFVLSESVDAIRALAAAAATDDILYYQVISFFNRKHLAKLCLLNIIDGIVYTQIPQTADKPVRELYDFGERNHQMHYELDACSYPLTVVDVIASPLNGFTLACCVDNFLIEGTSISVGGSPFTVVSSQCSPSSVGIVYVEEDVSGISEGDEVELT